MNKWLDTATGPGKAELTPASVDDDHEKYEIEVKTANERGSGTDSNIVLQVVGSAKTVDIHLQAKEAVSTNKDLFEDDQTDIFHVHAKDVGTIKKVVVVSDGKGLGSDWKLEYLKVYHKNQVYKYMRSFS